ncbi:MAG TPA: ATP-binding protein [Streptosporangiaceae bacterium]|nr:ATP-binding protein [Streptosporangiaceae bacterium]
MSVPAAADERRASNAVSHAVLVFLAALVAAGAGCWWAVLAAPDSMRRPTAWAAGAAAAVLAAALAGLTYYAETTYRTRRLISVAGAEAHLLKRELTQVAEVTMPALVQLLAEGVPADVAMNGVPVPASDAVRYLLSQVTYEVAEAGQRAAAAQAARSRLAAAVTELSGQTLPTVLQRLHNGGSAETVLAGIPAPAEDAVRGMLTGVVEEVASAEQRGAAAMAACASAAARIQAQTTRMLAELREMENRHSDDKVFADLMELDHRVSQLGRLSDSIALLAGGRSGRRWTKPIPMESILRGAMGRIDAYQRVRMHSVSAAAVVGYAAEGVMHALAELMDNAAAFSAHGSEVHVYVEDEDVGVVVTIEDSGLGMRKRERQRAEGLVSRAFDLATLPGTRMGLAVVGRLASRYGLTVNFRPSSRGGSGVVVMVPRQLIAQPRVDGGPQPHPVADAPPPELEPAGAAVAPPPSGGGPDEENLPKRPRGVTLAEASRAQELPPPRPSPTAGAGAPAPVDREARFAAFRRAGEQNRNGLPSPPPGPFDDGTAPPDERTP